MRPEDPGNRRSYQQYCGLARALDRVGERWTLLIVRDLLLGPRRYSDLLAGLPGLTTNLLAKRLREMEALGLLERCPEGYRLAEAGRALEPVILELGRWGGRFMGQPGPEDTLNIAWGLLSLKRRYQGRLQQRLALEVGPRRFVLDCHPDRLDVREGDTDAADARVRASEDDLRAILFRGAPSAGRADVTGDARAWDLLLATLAPMPTPK